MPIDHISITVWLLELKLHGKFNHTFTQYKDDADKPILYFS